MTPIEGRILQEQVRLVFQQLPAIIFIPGIGAVLLAIMHWGHIPDKNIIIWLVLVLVSTSGGASVLLFIYRKYKEKNITPKHWANAMNVLGGTSGITWGLSAYFLFSSDNIVLQLVLILYLFSASAVIALAMTAYRVTLYVVTGPMLICLGFRLFFENDLFHILLGVATVIFTISIFVFHYYVNQGFIDSIRLWFEKNELARELELRSIEAEQENKAKSRFLAAASHDLRQPLITQDLLLHALHKKIGVDTNVEIFSKLQSNINSLHSLFNELVEVSKLDTGNITANITSVDLGKLINEISNQCAPLAKEKGIGLETKTSTVYVSTDVILLERILKNLITNAIKYTSEGRVKISQNKVDDKISIIIDDTGIGISEVDKRFVFDEFYRTEKASENAEGFGLGLAIVKRLTNLLGHQLQLESTTGIGTKFSVTVPIST